MLYFAYGSNMDFDQMRKRCPSARFVAKAKLEAHRISFPRWSKKRNSGVASVEPVNGEDTWGVVYQIDELDLGALDHKEGFDPNRAPNDNYYNRREVRVLRDGNKDDPLTVLIYIAVAEGAFKPNTKYLDTILRGAEQWCLPENYVEKLKSDRRRWMTRRSGKP